MCLCIVSCLGEMCYSSVQMTSVLFNSCHVFIDSTRLLWLIAVLQQLQRLFTLVQRLF